MRDGNSAVIGGKSRDLGTGENGDSELFEIRAHLLGDIAVEAPEEPLRAVENRDGGAELREHRRELEPDGAATDDGEARRMLRDVLDLRGIEDPGAVDAGNRRADRDRTGVDDDRPGGDRELVGAAGDAHRLGAGELGVAVDDRDAGIVCELLVDGVELADERIAAILRGGQGIGVAAFRTDAGRGGRPRGRVKVRVCEQRLRRHAADVDAGTAVHVGGLLDQRDSVARLGAPHRDGLSGLAEAEDEYVEFVVAIAHGRDATRGAGWSPLPLRLRARPLR